MATGQASYKYNQSSNVHCPRPSTQPGPTKNIRRLGASEHHVPGGCKSAFVCTRNVIQTQTSMNDFVFIESV